MNNQLVKINNNDLSVKEFNGQRVVTFKDIDMLHERVEGTAKRNFSDNKKHFIKNVDYYELSKSDVGTDFVLTYEFDKKAPKGILITESGYLMLVKSLQDDLAWKVQRELVNKYFRVKETIPKMSKELQAILMMDNKQQQMDARITKLENNSTIDYSQQEELRNLGTKKVVAILGGVDAPAYKELNKKVFSSFWRDYKRKLNVNSYKNTLVKDFEIGRQAIINWTPSKEIKFMIDGCNAQMRM
ncbi:ORF6C domain-containing protein [Clostridium neonatale]|uniref:ORF6C domain-containing protein n=1 Tax=Clostridium neonatale TaxID=137838 RepID=UPI001E13CC8B|nr:ORF6C domain-containing protein [Clostridium neonatale]CAG9717655.1 conserved hypothetical protein [Clostridium neonatale]